MHILLYVIWFLLPLFFFIIALWAKLEQLSDRPKRQNPGDFFRQGVFVLVCVLISVVIDQYLLAALVDFLSSDWLPLGFFQALLLPFVLYLAARIVGPSQDVLITRAPKPSKKGR